MGSDETKLNIPSQCFIEAIDENVNGTNFGPFILHQLGNTLLGNGGAIGINE